MRIILYGQAIFHEPLHRMLLGSKEKSNKEEGVNAEDRGKF